MIRYYVEDIHTIPSTYTGILRPLVGLLYAKGWNEGDFVGDWQVRGLRELGLGGEYLLGAIHAYHELSLPLNGELSIEWRKGYNDFCAIKAKDGASSF